MAVLGIEMVSSEPVKGWEANSMCKRTDKPSYVVKAQEEALEAWKTYEALIDSCAPISESNRARAEALRLEARYYEIYDTYQYAIRAAGA